MYSDKDIEFANRILTDRKSLDDAEVSEWMEQSAHLALLNDLAATFQVGAPRDLHFDKDVVWRQLSKDAGIDNCRKTVFVWTAAAAVALLLIGFAVHFIYQTNSTQEKTVVESLVRTEPEGDAMLILSSGEMVALNRQVKVVDGVNEKGIRNNTTSELDFTSARVQSDKSVYNTMRIPKGGFYRLILSDGSKVWLNAMTELRFPVNFTGTERKVFLSGEAYFDVVQDKNRPFIVSSEKGIDVKVYGTEFNMNTDCHGTIQTLLVQGEVGISGKAVSNEVILKPNQKAEYAEETGKLNVEQVDPYPYVAWRYGEISFDRETIEQIMTRLERWYDVHVVYADESAKRKRFTGIINRYEDLSQVLRLLEGPETLRFDFDGSVVTVKSR